MAFVLADFEEISILYEGIKKMVKSQTVRSINKIVGSMHFFAAIEGSIGGKKMDNTRPPLNGYLSEIRFCAEENMS